MEITSMLRLGGGLVFQVDVFRTNLGSNLSPDLKVNFRGSTGHSARLAEAQTPLGEGQITEFCSGAHQRLIAPAQEEHVPRLEPNIAEARA